jgi:hypothetical protein
MVGPAAPEIIRKDVSHLLLRLRLSILALDVFVLTILAWLLLVALGLQTSATLAGLQLKSVVAFPACPSLAMN